MVGRKDLYINNEWKAAAGALLISRNPATEEVLWQGYAATEVGVNEAIEAARLAFPNWLSLTFEQRFAYIEKFHDRLVEKQDEVAEVISKETGKPLWESKSEVKSILNKIKLSSEAYQTRCQTVVKESPNGRGITRYKPHGVLVVLGPYNLPAHLPMAHIIPALLAGNTVVFKPSEHTPYVAETLMLLWAKSGLPKGVINMVQGGRDTGRFILSHPGINGLLFTGSWETGQVISELFSKKPDKILALEMGGNNPLVVTDVEDFKAAAMVTILSAYITSGQRCSCARRLIVPKGETGDKFIAALIEEIGKIKVGIYTDQPEPFMGPVINESLSRHLLAVQETLKLKGANVLVPMRLLKLNTSLVSPALIDVTPLAYRPDEEFFGPFLQLIRVDDFDAAIAEANKTSYGLTAGLISTNREQYDRFYKEVLAGVINWNVPLTGASGAAPFGGIKHSGNYRPSGFFSSDYCSYPVASTESDLLVMPEIPPGLHNE